MPPEGDGLPSPSLSRKTSGTPLIEGTLEKTVKYNVV